MNKIKLNLSIFFFDKEIKKRRLSQSELFELLREHFRDI